ncbi:P-loop NTPase fold protein [Nocardia sp. NPDC127606]|uniref:P-loop NTPase fold protein n=1 Tax=Nocardia sp. NPDC127606 TaxID=3345406 RepID=UPI00363A92FB
MTAAADDAGSATLGRSTTAFDHLHLAPSATYFGGDDPDSLAAAPTEWGLWATIEGQQVLVCGCSDGTLRFQSGDTGHLTGRRSSSVIRSVLTRSESREESTGRSMYSRVDGSGPALWGVQTEADGEWLLAVGMGNGDVRVCAPPEWSDTDLSARRIPPEIPDWDPLWVFSAQPGGPARWGAWSSIDGRPTLACGYGNGAVVIRQVPGRRSASAAGNPASRDIEHLLRGHVAPTRWGAWNEGSQLLATGDDDGVIIVWRIRPNDPVPWESVGRVEVGSAVTCGTWIDHTEDDRLLIVGTERGEVEAFLSVGDRRLERTPLFDNHPARQASVANTQGRGARWLTSFEDTYLWLACGFDDGLSVLSKVRIDVRPSRAPDPLNPAGIEVAHMELPPSPIGPSTWGSWAKVNDIPVLAAGYANGSVQLHVFDHRLVVDLTSGRSQGNWGMWQLIDDIPTLTTGDATSGTVTVWRLHAEVQHPRLPAYRTDNTTTVDQLDRTTEAKALAELVTSASTSLPLAVGLFGEWGEGKSHFLGLLREQVRDAKKQQWACHHVRQVSFNAWHYAETDLWSSLVTEMFGQLSRPEGTDLVTAQRQMSRLEAKLVAAHRIDERIAAESERIAELESDPTPPWWRMELSALRVAFSNTLWEQAKQQSDALDQRIQTATDEQWWKDARDVAALCNKGNRIRWTLTMILITTGVVGLFFLTDLARGASTAAVVIAIAFLQRLHHTSKRYTNSIAELMRKVDIERTRIEGERATALAVSRANLDALRREKHRLTAAGQLAGLVTDRAAEGGYRSSLGVMTRIREDFEEMSRLLLGNEPDSPRTAVDSVGDGLPSIDRIVLYIDDLDRCPPQRVVQLLEAIHLLLAVELFVVVVAVDPRWMLRSIATHYREMLMSGPESDGLVVDPDDDGHWSSTPPQYLEKIFQVVFTLPPLASGGYLSMMNTLIGRRGEAPNDAVPVERSTVTATPPPQVQTHRQESLPAKQRSTTTVPDLGHIELTETIAPMTMSDNEITLLGLLGPPLINTPRSVKRLANSYGLFSAIERIRSDEGTDEARLPALVLLGTLVAFPQLGPVLLTHLDAAPSTSTWPEFVDGLYPQSSTEQWANAADTKLTASEAEAWQLLSSALRGIGTRAEQVGIVLPEDITAWQRWIHQVGRLSFPAGRVVSGLSRKKG